MIKKSLVIMIISWAIVSLSLPLHAQEKIITLATSNWEPYYGENLKKQGFITHIATEAMKRSGYILNVKFIPWKRAVLLAQAGTYDGVLGAQKNSEREKSFIFSAPIGEIRNVLFSLKKKEIHYQEIEDLTPYKIGVIRGYAYSPAFDSATYLKKEVVDSLEPNIRKLLAGRVDLIVGSEKVVLHTLQKKFTQQADQVSILEPSLTESPIFIMFSKQIPNRKAYADAFNRGLETMKDDGTLYDILSFHGF